MKHTPGPSFLSLNDGNKDSDNNYINKDNDDNNNDGDDDDNNDDDDHDDDTTAAATTTTTAAAATTTSIKILVENPAVICRVFEEVSLPDGRHKGVVMYV